MMLQLLKSLDVIRLLQLVEIIVQIDTVDDIQVRCFDLVCGGIGAAGLAIRFRSGFKFESCILCR